VAKYILIRSRFTCRRLYNVNNASAAGRCSILKYFARYPMPNTRTSPCKMHVYSTQVHMAYSYMTRDRVCTLVEAISRTVIHKTIATCVAISTTVFKIGLYCEDKAVENGKAGPAVWRNISHVETFRPIRRNDSFRNPHRISRSSVFYVFAYCYHKRLRSHRKCHKYSFWQQLR